MVFVSEKINHFNMYWIFLMFFFFLLFESHNPDMILSLCLKNANFGLSTTRSPKPLSSWTDFLQDYHSLGCVLENSLKQRNSSQKNLVEKTCLALIPLQADCLHVLTSEVIGIMELFKASISSSVMLQQKHITHGQFKPTNTHSQISNA